MLALVALAATGSLLPYHPPKDGQRGVPATPDYSGIATRVANAVPIDSWINADLPAAAEAAAQTVVLRAEGGPTGQPGAPRCCVRGRPQQRPSSRVHGRAVGV